MAVVRDTPLLPNLNAFNDPFDLEPLNALLPNIWAKGVLALADSRNVKRLNTELFIVLVKRRE